MPPKLSAFPKCYLDKIAGERSMSVFDWIEEAKQLDADGLEMYEGFFTSLEPGYIDSVGHAIRDAGFAMPMLCCSPDFTNPDPDARKRAVEHEVAMVRSTRRLGGAGAVCRVLSGQRYPEVSREEGLEWAAECILAVLPVARESGVILGLENHYKDGFWKYPEFAQKKDVFLDLVNRIEDREYFGVQYDPSNAVVAGDDPVELLRGGRSRREYARSDRYLEPGATLDELKQSEAPSATSRSSSTASRGGAERLRRDFRILADVGYRGGSYRGRRERHGRDGESPRSCDACCREVLPGR